MTNVVRNKYGMVCIDNKQMQNSWVCDTNIAKDMCQNTEM